MDCQHKNYIAAGYPYEIDGKGIIRVSSLYEVYCTDCKNFVNLLSRKIINDKGLVRMWGENNAKS
jgi:hypothetical protein